MIPARSYSEPLRSHMLRRRWAHVRVVAMAIGAALGAAYCGLVIGHSILTTMLNLSALPPAGCC